MSRESTRYAAPLSTSAQPVRDADIEFESGEAQRDHPLRSLPTPLDLQDGAALQSGDLGAQVIGNADIDAFCSAGVAVPHGMPIQRFPGRVTQLPQALS